MAHTRGAALLSWAVLCGAIVGAACSPEGRKLAQADQPGSTVQPLVAVNEPVLVLVPASEPATPARGLKQAGEAPSTVGAPTVAPAVVELPAVFAPASELLTRRGLKQAGEAPRTSRVPVVTPIVVAVPATELMAADIRRGLKQAETPRFAPTFMAEGTFPATEAAAAGAFEAPLRGPLLAITPAPEAVSGRRLKQIEALRRIAPALEVLAIGAGFRASAAPGPERGQP